MSEERPTVPLTFRSGPSDPIRFEDGPGTYVETTLDAAPQDVWTMVTDLNLSAPHSEEFKGAEWLDPGPALGARFQGTNENEMLGEWQLVSYVDKFEEGRVFGWATSDPDNPGACWWFTLAPEGTGTKLRYEVSLGPGPSGLSMVIGKMPDKEARIIENRLASLNANMTRVVDSLHS